MSDTSTSTLPADPATDQGFTVRLDSSLIKLAQDDTSISAAAARKLIEQRLRAGAKSRPERRAAEAVAKLIVRALPAEANVPGSTKISEKIVTNLDLRPYLQQIADKNIALPDLTPDDYREIDAYVQNQGHSPVMDLLDAEQVKAQTVKRQQNVDQGKNSETDIASVSQFDPAIVTLSPEARATQAQAAIAQGGTTGEAAADYVNDPYADLYNEVKPTFPEADYQQLIKIGLVDFADIITAESQFNADNQTSGMQTGVLMDVPGRGPDIPGSAGDRPAKRMSLTSILDLPNTLNYDEVAQLQEKLAMAGYFDRIGQDYIEGEADDKATQAAWQAALVDAYHLQGTDPKTSVVQMLARKGVEYRQEVQRRSADKFGKLDTDLVRSSADEMAVQLLGRTLDDGEFGKIRDELLRLRADRGNDIIGVDDMTWAQDDTAKRYGFTSDDINNRIKRDFAPEIGASNGRDFMQGIYKAFGLDIPGSPAAVAAAAEANGGTMVDRRDPTKKVVVPGTASAE